MKIGIDARFYGPSRGIGRYSQELIANLEKIDQQNEYVIFLTAENFDLYQSQNLNFKKVLAPWNWYSLAEQIFLPLKLYKYNLDLVHFLHYNVPLLYFRKFIVTVHDVILIYFPSRHKGVLNWILYGFKNLFFNLVLRRTVFSAKKIITDSNFTKNKLSQHFKILDQTKIKTIYLS